jgi:hypothetical protein
MILGRFILRFLLVPLGICFAVSVGMLVVMLAEWQAFVAYINANPDAAGQVVELMFVAPWALVVLSRSALVMLSPGVIGILISEFFAVRSWIFHVANGILSAWVGWSLTDNPGSAQKFFADPKVILIMGLSAGIAYWAVAGWSAGFWKPVFREARPPSAPLPAPGQPKA